MSLFSHLENNDKKIVVEEWEDILPKWAYTDREWKNMIRNPDNSKALVRREVSKETNYYRERKI